MLSRSATLLGAAAIATLTFAVVAHAAPSEFSFSYNLAAGAVTSCVTPLASIPNQIVGVDTTSGFRGVAQVSLLRISGAFLEWVGLESPSAAAITSGFSGTAGRHIVFLDFSHGVQIEVCTTDSFRVHNNSSVTHTGVVDLFY
jgi:hypothetical protein